MTHSVFWKDPLSVYQCFRRSGSVLLYSPSAPARWSYLCSEPFLEFKAFQDNVWINGKTQKHSDPLLFLKVLFRKYAYGRYHDPRGPPFQGGLIGYLAYEALHYLEDVSFPRKDDVRAPWLHFFFFDHGLEFDHFRKKVHAFGPEEKVKELAYNIDEDAIFGAGQTEKIKSNFTKPDYIAAVQKIKEKIEAGETYQANLSQRFECQTRRDPLDVFKKLSALNPSPYAAFFQTPELTIASNSPELLFSISGRRIVTRPIKGTRPRGKTRREDVHLQRELQSSEKDNAELTMIVDLARNDVGKICKPGTVKTNMPFDVEKYSHVQHLVGHVEGTLWSECNAFDALRALFPGGSITGCPKVRTMQILRDVEPVARGPYTGSLGWIGWNGDAAFNILIRTMYFKGKKAFFHSGGGIVYDSDPEKEWEETLHKAEAMRTALEE